MAVLEGRCYGSTGNDGNIQVPDKWLGNVSITVSGTSASADLPQGTKLVLISTDATVRVFFTFGKDSATATTSDDFIDGAVSEQPRCVGINGKENNKIAAVTA